MFAEMYVLTKLLDKDLGKGTNGGILPSWYAVKDVLLNVLL